MTKTYTAFFLLVSLLSLVGTAFARDDNPKSLPTEVRKAMQRFKYSGEGLSIFVQKIGDTEPLLAFNSNTPRNPASAIKLLTTLVALETLSPAYRWRTYLFTDGEIIDGTLAGNLIIRGGGDPYLSIERVWLLVRQLRRRGIDKITGNLIIDQSLFAEISEDPGSFDERPLRSYNVVPAALVSNFNVTRLTFKPDKANRRVRVLLEPELENLDIKNALKLVNIPCGGYQRGIALTQPSNNVLRLDGRFSSRCKSYSMGRSVTDKNAYTAELFRQLWRQSGGKWNGSWKLGEVGDDDSRIMRFSSPALVEVIRLVNKYSNNLMTRMLFLTLGIADDSDEPATREKSLTAIEKWLADKNLQIPELHVANGAGSSRDTRISAHSLAQLLLAGWQSPYMPEYIASLSLSGQDGTFRKRHKKSALTGRVHAKTGRLDHVVSLAGYYQSNAGDRYIIVLMHNAKDVHRGGGHGVQDALLRWLAKTVE